MRERKNKRGKVPSVPSALAMEGLEVWTGSPLSISCQCYSRYFCAAPLHPSLAGSWPCHSHAAQLGDSPICIQPLGTCHLHLQSPRSKSYLRPFLVLWFWFYFFITQLCCWKGKGVGMYMYRYIYIPMPLPYPCHNASLWHMGTGPPLSPAQPKCHGKQSYHLSGTRRRSSPDPSVGLGWAICHCCAITGRGACGGQRAGRGSYPRAASSHCWEGGQRLWEPCWGGEQE